MGTQGPFVERQLKDSRGYRRGYQKLQGKFQTGKLPGRRDQIKQTSATKLMAGVGGSRKMKWNAPGGGGASKI